jgi:hypothetical protein
MYDAIAVLATSGTPVITLFNCDFNNIANNTSTFNSGMTSRCLVTKRGTIYAYGCRFYAYSDASAIADSSSNAKCLDMPTGGVGTVYLMNCSYESYAAKNGTGTADGSTINIVAGTAYITGGRVLSMTGAAGDTELDQTGGTLTVEGLTYNRSSKTGTITYGQNDAMPSETITADGALSIYGYSALDEAGAALANLTLADGVYNGQTKYIFAVDTIVSGTEEAVVSIAHHITSDPEVYYFDAGEYLWLVWQNTDWYTMATTANTAAD